MSWQCSNRESTFAKIKLSYREHKSATSIDDLRVVYMCWRPALFPEG